MLQVKSLGKRRSWIIAGILALLLPVGEILAFPYAPSTLTFTVVEGTSSSPARTVTFSKKSFVSHNWAATAGSSWLQISPASGTISTEKDTISVQVNPIGFSAGTYSSAFTIAITGRSGGIQTATIPVTLTVTAASTIGASPTNLSYAATQGAVNPSNQTVTVTNTGGTLNWTASGNATWLSLTPASGSGTGTLTAGANTAGLAAGTYTGTITVAASGSASQTVGIALTVNPPATSSATLMWDANTELDLAGYKVYRATASGAYGAPIATLSGNVTSYISASLQVGTTYFFIVTAYDTAGNESLHSNEVSKSIY